MHDIEQTEQVQRRFTKRLPGLKMLSYTDRLDRLRPNIPSLELRRLNTDYPSESEGLCFYRRWFVCLSVCLLPR